MPIHKSVRRAVTTRVFKIKRRRMINKNIKSSSPSVLKKGLKFADSKTKKSIIKELKKRKK